jgi:hypothetical protein
LAQVRRLASVRRDLRFEAINNALDDIESPTVPDDPAKLNQAGYL